MKAAAYAALTRIKKGLSDKSLSPCFDGGAGRNRTDDLYNAIVALSQLSYSPMPIKHFLLTQEPREVFFGLPPRGVS